MSDSDKSVINNSGATPPEGRQKAFKGVVWSLMERSSTQLATFVVTIILARLLTPEDFGLVGMLLIFIETGEALASSGFARALVKRGFKNPDDAPSALAFNVAAGVGIYGIIWFGAPLISEFYDLPRLTSIARVIALVVPLRAATAVSIGRLTASLDFKVQGIASFTAIILGGFLAIAAAVKGFGVWALVVYQIANNLFLFIALTVASRRELGGTLTFRRINLTSVKALFGFGWKLTAARLADVVYTNSYVMVIGLLFPVGDVGFFTRGRQLASVPAISCGEIVGRVAYPIICCLSDGRTDTDSEGKLRRVFLEMIKLSMFVATPLMLTLLALSQPIIYCLLGEKWISAAPLMMVLCLGTLWIPLDSLNLILLPALNKPGTLMRLEILRKIIGLIFLGVSIPFGLDGICVGFAIASLATMVLTTHVVGKSIGVGTLSQIKAIGGILLISIMAAVASWSCSLIIENPLLQLISGLLAASVVYIVICRIFRRPEPAEIYKMLRKYLSR